MSTEEKILCDIISWIVRTELPNQHQSPMRSDPVECGAARCAGAALISATVAPADNRPAAVAGN